MKTHITDALQVIAAILITGGLVASAAPLPESNSVTQKPVAQTAVVEQSKSPEKPVEATQSVPAQEKPVTWQDNPNHCTDAQYIAQESPFACINKPVQSASVAQAAIAPATPATATSGNCGDNMYKQYIYQHESGCRTTAVNSIGCRGLGQACPGSKLPCGDDFACQDAYFISYAVGRYGSWEQAYYFWLQNHWW